MAGDSWDAQYSANVGFVLVFNLIVGTGALALPKAFRQAGYILSIVLLVVSGFASYVSATFVIEGLALANAATRSAKLKRKQKTEPTKKEIEEIYNITQRTEVSAMAKLFMGDTGVMILMLIMAVYLFGDLAIYSVAVPKSLMNVICSTHAPQNTTVSLDDPCWDSWPAWSDRMAVYRICVASFIAVVTPLVVMGVSKTKYLQMATSLCRWIAFILMIVLACIMLSKNGSPGIPKPVIVNGFGSLFGTTVYAFMCHHSLPGLITPMRSKKFVFGGVLGVYVCVLIFYVALAVTGAFAFVDIYDVYTLNFLHSAYFDSVFNKICNYFLALFPVFTITSNYPIVACTLINNLLVFFDMCETFFDRRDNQSTNKVSSTAESPQKMDTGEADSGSAHTQDGDKLSNSGSRAEAGTEAEEAESPSDAAPDEIEDGRDKSLTGEEEREKTEERERRHTKETEDRERKSTSPGVPKAKPRLLRRYILMVVLLGSAALIAMFTDNVLLLAEVTGSYPGVGVQYIIPSLIVIFGRKHVQREFGKPVPSCASSPFSSFIWPYITLAWSAFTIIMVSLNFAHFFDTL